MNNTDTNPKAGLAERIIEALNIGLGHTQWAASRAHFEGGQKQYGREADTIRAVLTEVEASRPTAPAQAVTDEQAAGALIRRHRQACFAFATCQPNEHAEVSKELLAATEALQAAFAAQPVQDTTAAPSDDEIPASLLRDFRESDARAAPSPQAPSEAAGLEDAWVSKGLSLAHDYAIAREWQGDAHGAYEALRLHLSRAR